MMLDLEHYSSALLLDHFDTTEHSDSRCGYYSEEVHWQGAVVHPVGCASVGRLEWAQKHFLRSFNHRLPLTSSLGAFAPSLWSATGLTSAFLRAAAGAVETLCRVDVKCHGAA